MSRQVQRLLEDALVQNEPWELTAAQKLIFRPILDDTGSIEFGTNTHGWDFKVWLGATQYILFDRGANSLTLEGVTLTVANAATVFANTTITNATLAGNTTINNATITGSSTIANATLTGTSTIANATLTGTVTTIANATLTGTSTVANATLTGTSSIANATLEGNTVLSNTGRLSGFNSLSPRYELEWVAGNRGKPGINADIQDATEAVREITDPDFEIGGVNSTSALCTYNSTGGIKVTTAGADGDEMILIGHLDNNQSPWEMISWITDEQVIWETHIKSGTNVTNAIIWAGLKVTSTEVLSTDANQIFFRYEDDVSGGAWVVVESIANVDTSTVTAVIVAVLTQYHLRIVIDSARVAKCYINGTLVRTSAALNTGTAFRPYIGVAADGAAAAKHIVIYGESISKAVS